ncbi:hypothetical protein NDU88_004009 [Pleurodeles waltl]|uniref:Uncharacterized protein n=1 Tax=Pleurodeles waltl TaxID=8319 RepID=A0AAV7T6M0_PLEWA|nr:hypothetical protein NDU88_004009 [Pleurodeles waltl]
MGPDDRRLGGSSRWQHPTEPRRRLDLKELRPKPEEVSETVATLEEHENSRDEEIVQLQQEVIPLQGQQIVLQAHMEDLLGPQFNTLKGIVWPQRGGDGERGLMELTRGSR